MPQVSVIVPNYNHSKYLTTRLKSITNQSFQDYEIILLDDASTDDSLAILQEFSSHPKVKCLISNKENSGSPFHQWNKGIEHAQGDLIWIAETDDWADSEFLATLVPVFSDRSIALAYCSSYNVDEFDNIIEVNQWNYSLNCSHWTSDFIDYGNNEIKNYLNYKNTIYNASSVVFKKSVYVEIKYHPNLRYLGDWLLWVQIIKDRKLFYTHKPLNYFRHHHKSSRTSKTLSEEINRLKEAEYVIDSLIKHNDLKISLSNFYKWNWIFNNIILCRQNFYKSIHFYFPPLRHKILFFVFYVKLLTHILKKPG